jgi:HD-like signal output (HDOD) protein
LNNVLQAAKLISLPDIYYRLREILDDPDHSLAEVAVVISKDPALTLRLLSIVNSSLYSFAKKVDTVSRAITLLGTLQVHDLVLATSVATTFKGMSSRWIDMKNFWWRSVYCAVASRQLAILSSDCDRERLFVAGLLHDIGHLMMYQAIPDLAQQSALIAQESNRPLYLVEQEHIGFTSATVGAELMTQWKLPESLSLITRFHTEPERAEQYRPETVLVHVGALLSRADAGEGLFNEGPLTVNPATWSLTGLTPEECLTLSQGIGQDLAEIIRLLFPEAG